MNYFNHSLSLIIALSITLIFTMSCDDDPASADDDINDEPEVELTPENTSEALHTLLVDEGLIPEEGLYLNQKAAKDSVVEHLEKYVEIVSLDDDTEGDYGYWGYWGYLRVYLDQDNHIIPHSVWRDENPDYCAEKGLEMKTPEIIIDAGPLAGANYIGDGYYTVDIYVKDYHTRQVKNQFSALVHVSISDQVHFSNEDNYELIELFRPTEGPCIPDENGEPDDDPNGDLIVYFDSEINAEVITDEGEFFINTAVEAEIEAGYSEDSGLFIGESTLSHRLYDNSLSEFDCTFDTEDGTIRTEFESPESESLDQFDFYMTAPADDAGDAPSVSMECDGIDEDQFDFQMTFWFPTFAVIHHEYDNIDEEREAFRFTGWEESDDPDIIAVQEMEHSLDLTDFDDGFEGAESLPVEEVTLIEIRLP